VGTVLRIPPAFDTPAQRNGQCSLTRAHRVPPPYSREGKTAGQAAEILSVSGARGATRRVTGQLGGLRRGIVP